MPNFSNHYLNQNNKTWYLGAGFLNNAWIEFGKEGEYLKRLIDLLFDLDSLKLKLKCSVKLLIFVWLFMISAISNSKFLNFSWGCWNNWPWNKDIIFSIQSLSFIKAAGCCLSSIFAFATLKGCSEIVKWAGAYRCFRVTKSRFWNDCLCVS